MENKDFDFLVKQIAEQRKFLIQRRLRPAKIVLGKDAHSVFSKFIEKANIDAHISGSLLLLDRFWGMEVLLEPNADWLVSVQPDEADQVLRQLD